GDHADRAGAFGDRHPAGMHCDLGRPCRPAREGGPMKPSNALTASALALALAGCGGGEDTVQEYGTSPTLPEPTRGLLPSMNIAEPVPWGDQTPTVPSG